MPTMITVEQGDPIPAGLREIDGLLVDRTCRVVGSVRQTCEVYPKRRLGEPLTADNRGLICRCGAEGVKMELDTDMVRATHQVCAADCCKEFRRGLYQDGWRKVS